MTRYLNLKNGESKESWLMYHGRRQHEVPKFDPNSDLLLVCLVDNGPFTAAAICDSPADLHAFSLPEDHRPKQWWLVSRKALADV